MSAVGHGPLSYEWQKDEKNITHPECTGSNTANLTITFFTSMHQGHYSCIIKDNHKSLKSEPSNLALSKCCLSRNYNCLIEHILCFKTDPIISHPQSKACELHAPVSLSVSAVGEGNLSYQWKKDDLDITDRRCIGIDTSTLTIISFSDAHVGKYTCTVQDSKTSVQSNPAQLDLSKYNRFFQ